MVWGLRTRRTVAGVFATGLLVASLAGCKGYVALEKPGNEPSQETTTETDTPAGIVDTEPAQPESTEDALEASIPTEPGTIMILATGGTIAGVGEKGESVEYEPGTLTVDQLIASVPEIKDVAPIKYEQICNINSDDITAEIWLDIVRDINARAADPDVAGFVITHGTDTLEETAYFLDLTLKTDKPVVVTGSMRPASSISPDGLQNLYDAVVVAASPEAAGKGVLVTFADRIYPARDVTKRSTYYVGAISAGEEGDIGVVRDDEAYFFETPGRLHTTATEFDVSGMRSLPKVSIVYFNVDADPDLLTYAAEYADGIVIAGAGAGEYSEEFLNVIESLEKPVVISSRVGDGIITQNGVLSERTIAGSNLPPQKAAILLRLALATGDASFERLLRLFATY